MFEIALKIEIATVNCLLALYPCPMYPLLHSAVTLAVSPAVPQLHPLLHSLQYFLLYPLLYPLLYSLLYPCCTPAVPVLEPVPPAALSQAQQGQAHLQEDLQGDRPLAHLAEEGVLVVPVVVPDRHL